MSNEKRERQLSTGSTGGYSLTNLMDDEKDVHIRDPQIVKWSSHHEDQSPNTLFDESVETRWNAGHLSGWDGPNWVVFDFGEDIRLQVFAIRCCGDGVHDGTFFNRCFPVLVQPTHTTVKELHLQTAEDPESTRWKTVATFQGQSGITSWQTFYLSGVSRYWRMFITERFSRYQAYMTGIKFIGSDGM